MGAGSSVGVQAAWSRTNTYCVNQLSGGTVILVDLIKTPRTAMSETSACGNECNDSELRVKIPLTDTLLYA
jgi:hypothetical protein